MIGIETWVSKIYLGHWPKVVSRTAKYSVRMIDGEWRITVYMKNNEGTKILVVEEANDEIVEVVNSIKLCHSSQEGGAFYINEYGHLIVPNIAGYYFSVDRVWNVDFFFRFEGKLCSTKPVDENDLPLQAGDNWYGPKPGIPYVLESGGNDIKFKKIKIESGNPTKWKMPVSLLDNCFNKTAANENIQMVKDIRGQSGGRFYVNEHKAVFTPVTDEEEDGLNYVYCGKLNMDGWFPIP